MRIESLTVENFRAIEKETVVFDDYTCIVGPNGCGKSTVLTALNIFFRETQNASTDLVELSREDFHHQRIENAISITVTFDDLSTDEEHDLKDYVRQGKLIVSAVAKWNEASQTADVKQYGHRLGIEEFRKYFELEKSKSLVGPLQQCYVEMQKQFPDLPSAKTKPQMQEALHKYEAEHPQQCRPLPSEDEFYGFRGVGKLEKYVQWVYVPAVKDAKSEQAENKSSAIGKLLARRVHAQLSIEGRVDVLKQETTRQYKIILEENEDALKKVSESLNIRFHEWAHDHADLELQWQDQEKSVSITKPTAEVKATEGLFKGDLARFGHGLQRSFIFTLLQELSEHKNTGPRLILGCEEPELYQHPPQAKHLASVLQKLSALNAQVFVCTHSPYFVSGRTFENVRLASKNAVGRVSIKQAKFEEVSKAIATATGKAPAKPGGMTAKIEQEMESPLKELFFASFRVFVEGIEDAAYISSYLSLLNYWDRFRSLGGHIVRVDGKSHLTQALAISNEFKLPYFVVFDCDGDTPEDAPSKATGKRLQHERDNRAIFHLAGATNKEPFPKAVLMETNVAAWPTKLSDVVEAEIGNQELGKIKENVRATYGFNENMDKNALFIGYFMAAAWDQGLKSATLQKLCCTLLKLGESSLPTVAYAQRASGD